MEKIKLIHIINALSVGGIESTTVALCNRLDTSRYDVTLLTLSNSDLALKDKVCPYVKLITLPRKHQVKSFANTLLLFFWLPKIISIFALIKPHIIHTHIYQYDAIPVLSAVRLSSTAKIHFHTIHAAGIHYANKKKSDSRKLAFESFFYSICKTHLVCVSNTVGDLAKNHLSGFVDLQVISNGVDVGIFNKNKYSISKSNKFKLIYVARLFEGKNHITLLKAMKILVRKYADIQLILVGDGPKRTELEEYVSQHKLTGFVDFLGDRINIAEILCGADVGVFPTEHEGDGVALTEMMAMRIAIVASNIKVVRDKFLNSEDACFFETFDYAQLAEKIKALYFNRALLKKLQERAYENSKKFRIDNVVNLYEAYYASALKRMSII